MSLPFSERRIQHTGNGAVKVFSYNFKLFDSDDVKVIVADDDGVEFPELVLGVDFSISGIGAAAGGNITLIDSGQSWLDGDGDLLTDYTITIEGEKEPTQETALRNNGPFYPEVIEARFDILVALIQELKTKLSRAIVASTSVNISNISLGSPTALFYLRWNAAADSIEAVAPPSGINSVSGETPAGSINNSNQNFTIANSPSTGSFRLYRNGARTTDFTLVGQNLTTGFTPNFGEELICDYTY